STVAFGDSNTTDFAAGIVNWYERLAALNSAQPLHRVGLNDTMTVYNLTFNNQSLGGKSVAATMLGNQNAQYDIVGALSHISNTDVGLVLLGTNDAYRGVTVPAFVAADKNLIATIHASGKVGRLVFLSVPPMTPPYNCAANCFPFPNNPQVDRVIP